MHETFQIGLMKNSIKPKAMRNFYIKTIANEHSLPNPICKAIETGGTFIRN